ncbi:MAG: transposase [Catenibacterium sp.]
MGVDMKQFESDKQLACWAGLAPRKQRKC